MVEQDSINLNLLECKLYLLYSIEFLGKVLILTYWNVNPVCSYVEGKINEY